MLFAVTDDVKLDDGTRAEVTTSVTYDPVAGTYEHALTTAGGAVIERVVRETSAVPPTAAELATALALVAEHAEVAPLIAGARGPVTVEGGFPLVREAGHACGPGGRCVLVDVWETLPDGSRQRLRYAVVDLRAVAVLDADADPEADSNLANPAARRMSRQN